MDESRRWLVLEHRGPRRPEAPTSYPQTSWVRPTRHPERAGGDAAAIHSVLDEALICHLGAVVDGAPVVLPTIHARVGSTLYLHASTGARLVRMVPDDGLPVCVTVTVVDGLVLARSQFHHSMNYRSVVVHGRAFLVTDDGERRRALAAVVDHVVPGRSAASRPGQGRELAATAVLRIPLTEVSLKRRTGPPQDDEDDLGLPHWAGVIPVRTAFGPVVPAADLAEGIPVPAHVTGYARPR